MNKSDLIKEIYKQIKNISVIEELIECHSTIEEIKDFFDYTERELVGILHLLNNNFYGKYNSVDEFIKRKMYRSLFHLTDKVKESDRDPDYYNQVIDDVLKYVDFEKVWDQEYKYSYFYIEDTDLNEVYIFLA